MSTIKIVSVDDHQSFSDGLKAIFENETGLEFLYSINEPQEVVTKLKEQVPDVILLDIKMDYDEKAGINLCETIKGKFGEDIKVIMLSQYDTVDIFKAARKAGADGHLLKTSGREEILKAIMTVCRGKKYLGEKVTQIIIEDGLNEPEKNLPPDKPYKAFDITDREFDVLNTIKDGKTNLETANTLFISESTVKSHIQSLLSKAGVKNRTELISWARLKNLI